MKRKIFSILFALVLVVGFSMVMAVPVVAEPAPAWSQISLENKDASWAPIVDDTLGTLLYSPSGKKFKFRFLGRGLQPKTEYSLIYYADKPNPFTNWGGDNPGALIGKGKTNKKGILKLKGSKELNMDLPCPPDTNAGAKIWLVPSSDYDKDKAKVIAWNPTQYLFECNLINYDDTDGQMLCLENKDASWAPIVDDTLGTLLYSPSGKKFKFRFLGRGLQPKTEYSLIYYADKPNPFTNWGGDNPGALIGKGKTNKKGILKLKGSKELNMDLPCPPDANIDEYDYSGAPDYYAHAHGAKIWLVPSDDYNVGMKKVIAWNPTQYLFESDLITYDDTDVGVLCLDNKTATWAPILDGTLGGLVYNLAGPQFQYSFLAHGLSPNTGYSLIYYADPWPGNNPGALITSGMSDGSGGIVMSGSIELSMDLPDPADANYSTYGAKIWLVPSSDYDKDKAKVIAWNPTQYLFEMNGITYDDTDVP